MISKELQLFKAIHQDVGLVAIMGVIDSISREGHQLIIDNTFFDDYYRIGNHEAIMEYHAIVSKHSKAKLKNLVHRLNRNKEVESTGELDTSRLDILDIEGLYGTDIDNIISEIGIDDDARYYAGTILALMSGREEVESENIDIMLKHLLHESPMGLQGLLLIEYLSSRPEISPLYSSIRGFAGLEEGEDYKQAYANFLANEADPSRLSRELAKYGL